jgi:hypothetical protein
MLRFFFCRLSAPFLICERLIALAAFLILVVPAGAQEAAEGKEGDKQPAATGVKEITEGVKAFFAADLGDTDVRIAQKYPG